MTAIGFAERVGLSSLAAACSYKVLTLASSTLFCGAQVESDGDVPRYLIDVDVTEFQRYDSSGVN